MCVRINHGYPHNLSVKSKTKSEREDPSLLLSLKGGFVRVCWNYVQILMNLVSVATSHLSLSTVLRETHKPIPLLCSYIANWMKQLSPDLSHFYFRVLSVPSPFHIISRNKQLHKSISDDFGNDFLPEKGVCVHIGLYYITYTYRFKVKY